MNPDLGMGHGTYERLRGHRLMGDDEGPAVSAMSHVGVKGPHPWESWICCVCGAEA